MIRTGEAVARWVCNRLGSSFTEGSAGIGLERNGVLVAGVCYDNWTGRSIMAHIVIDGRLTRQYLYAIFHYPFTHVGAEKIYCPIVCTNKASINLCKKMGFDRETTLSDAHPDGDIYFYSLRRDKCRFTGVRYGKVSITPARA